MICKSEVEDRTAFLVRRVGGTPYLTPNGWLQFLRTENEMNLVLYAPEGGVKGGDLLVADCLSEETDTSFSTWRLVENL